MDTSSAGSSPTGTNSPTQQNHDQNHDQARKKDAPPKPPRNFNLDLASSSSGSSSSGSSPSSPTGADFLLADKQTEEHPDTIVRPKPQKPARPDHWRDTTTADIIEVDYRDFDQYSTIEDFVKLAKAPVYITEFEDFTPYFTSAPRSQIGSEDKREMRQLRNQNKAKMRDANDTVIKHWHDFINRYPTKNLTHESSERKTSSLDKSYAESQALTVLDDSSDIQANDNLADGIVNDILRNTDNVYDILQHKNSDIQEFLNAIADLAILYSAYGENVYSNHDEITSKIINDRFSGLDQSAKTAVSSRLSSVHSQALVGLIGNYSIKIGANQEIPRDLVLKMKKLLIQFQNAAIAQEMKQKSKQPSKKDYIRAGNALNIFFQNYGENFVRLAGKLTEDPFREIPDGNSNPLEFINLFKQKRSAESNLSEDFENELLKSKFVLEYPDGNRQWLTDFKIFGSKDPVKQQLHKSNCIKKLKTFCEQQSLLLPKNTNKDSIYTKFTLKPFDLIAFLANSKGMKMDDTVREFLHSQNALPLPLVAKTTSDTGETNTVQTITAKSDDLYIIKAYEDGSFTVKLHSFSPISHCVRDNSEMNTNLSPHFSHWNTITEVRLDADGTRPKLENFMFDYAAVALLDVDNANKNQVSKAVQLTEKQSKAYWDTKLAIPMFSENPAGMDFNNSAAKSLANKSIDSFMMSNSNTFKDLRANIETNKKCFNAQEIEELNRIVIQLEKSAAIIRMAGSDYDALSHINRLSGKYEHLRYILNRSFELADEWANIPNINTVEAEEDKIAVYDRLTTCHALTQLAATLIGKSQDAVYDFRAAADDQRVSDNHEISKIENASLQTAAVVQTLTEIYDECVEKERVAKQNAPGSNTDYHSEDIKALLLQMTTHAQKIHVNLADVRANRAEPMSFGTGIPDKKFKKSAKAIVTGLLRGKKKAPWEHSTYSQAQLASLRIMRLVRQKPYLKATLRKFDKIYARNYVATLENQDWSPTVNDFNDVYFRTTKGVTGFDKHPTTISINEYKMLKSTVTHAPSIQGDMVFTKNYGGKGMPSCNRIQAKHMNNLSHSQLSNRQNGKVMFAGLRHGFIDAYDIRPETMSSATVEEKQALLNEIGNEDLNLNSFRNTREIANVRASANEKVAKELVAAAVIADPVLLQNAKDGKQVRLNLDSVLLGSPDVTAFPRNSGKADHRLQANQRAALARLGNNVTIPMMFPIEGENFQKRDVNVALSVRSYTFPFSRHALSKNWLVKLFVRPFLGLRRADQLNQQPFTELLGNLDQDVIGGEAAAMAAHLMKQQLPLTRIESSAPQSLVTSLATNQQDELSMQEPASLLELSAQQKQKSNLSEIRPASDVIDDPAKSIAQARNFILENFSFVNEDPKFDNDFADNIEARIQNMPFESREDLAEAILTLARDTKRILRERIHHGAVHDPCLLAARVSMLSYLLGRTPAYSCKTGIYRTGMLDTSIKMLAADTAAKRIPAPESSVGERRYAMYTLSTGNLETQQINTGRRGYNPKKFPWQLMNVQSASTRNLIVDESKSR